MNRIARWFREFGEALEAIVHLKAAEIQTGVPLIEAANVDTFNLELRMLTSTEEEREGIRRGAVMIAQLGWGPKEVEQAARLWHDAFVKDTLPNT